MYNDYYDILNWGFVMFLKSIKVDRKFKDIKLLKDIVIQSFPSDWNG